MDHRMTTDYLTLVKPWNTEPPRELARTRIFTLYSARASSPTNPSKAGDFVYLECTDWVNVVAITPDRHVVMIEQYRHGTREVTLELPGGMVDHGESPATACERELLEETGYKGSPVELIGIVSSNPAMQTNHTHTGLVRDAVLAAPQHLDGAEEIATRLVPLADVPDLVRRGVIHHALVVAALFHHALHTGR
jgi:ADP-ribose pyrophosphatase